jgi:hypothetical protein
VASDGIQWILRRHNEQGSNWHPVSFVHSTRDVLARCMREHHVPAEDAAVLLAGLPATFAESALEQQPA